MIGKARLTGVTFLLALFAACSLMAAPAQLLSDAESQASLLKSDLDTISFFGSSGSGWQSHSGIVVAYRQHIVSLRSLAVKLEGARKDASPSQNIAIEHIIPVLQEFAATADAAIGAIDRNPSGLNGNDYKQYVKLTSDLAGEFSSLITSWVNYGKTSEELGRAAEKIGAPVPPLH